MVVKYFSEYWKKVEKETKDLETPPLPYFRLKAVKPEEAAKMSCHDIGHAINTIMAKVLEMYDDGKLSKESTLEMIYEFPKAVYWCEGNESEAQETLTETHCAACLKRYSSADERICYDDLDIGAQDVIEGLNGNRRKWWFDELNKIGFNGRSLCWDCFEKYLVKNLKETGRNKILDK